MIVFAQLELLEHTSSRLDKERILENNRDNEPFKTLLLYAMDPYRTYGVRQLPLLTSLPMVDPRMGRTMFPEFIGLLNKLSARELTGDAAREAVQRLFDSLTPKATKWYSRVLLKNLQIGVTAKTVNKVWPRFIPCFDLQLAHPLREARAHKLEFPAWVDPKIDGLRLVAIKSDGDVRLFTRKGHEIFTHDRLVRALEAAPFDDVVLDGEIQGADWNETQSIITSKVNAKDPGALAFNLFDAVPYDTWITHGESASYRERRHEVSRLVDMIGRSKILRSVPGKEVMSLEEAQGLYALFLRQGYEGAMIKNLEAPYQFKRTDAVIKLKPCDRYTGKVVGHYEGHANRKWEGKFGGFEVEVDGVVTNVGGGFTDEQRLKFGRDADRYIGRYAEVEAQQKTNDGKLRHPVFIGFRSEADL